MVTNAIPFFFSFTPVTSLLLPLYIPKPLVIHIICAS